MVGDENFREEPGRFTRALALPARAVRILTGDSDRPSVPTPAVEHDAIVDCALYVDGIRQQKKILDYRKALEFAREQRGAFVWLGLHTPTAEQMKGIAEAFELHELAVEDVVERRPAAQAGAVRRGSLPGPAHGPLRRARRADRALGGGRDRSGHAAHRR